MSADNLASRFTTRIPGAQKKTPDSITITGVPPYVTRERICEAVRLLGIDPSEVRGMSFDDAAVHVEVYSSERPYGLPAWRWTPDGKEAATHRLTIPIVDKEPT